MWFRTLFGFDEIRPMCRTRDRLCLLTERGTNWMRAIANDRLYRIGTFSTPSLEQIRQQAHRERDKRDKSAERRSEPTSPSFSSPFSYSHRVIGDILEIHSQFPGGTFQVASQLNCLEFSSPNVTPEDGVGIYANDPTQGPACALACAAGTVYRNYFVSPPTNPPGVIGQYSESQLNNLDQLEQILNNDHEKFWVVKNGYFNSTPEALRRLNRVLTSHDSSFLRDQIKVGLHDDVGVTFLNRYTPIPLESGEEIYVTQVYCSALSCAYSDQNISSDLWQPLAELVLQAIYEATIWGAVLNHLRGGSSVLFLTFVGGGVYGNKKEWIARSIGRALAIAKKSNCELEVMICHHNRIDEEIEQLINYSFEAEMS